VQLLAVQTPHLPRHTSEAFDSGCTAAFTAKPGLAAGAVIERPTGFLSAALDPRRSRDGAAAFTMTACAAEAASAFRSINATLVLHIFNSP
jgi:hypothetical protein